MEEIYWITRLGNLKGSFIALTIIFGILSAIFFIFSVASRNENWDEKDSILKSFKRVLSICTVSVLGLIFTPSTNEALMIWGIGGTIDYIKTNDTAKQLPDKCIEALDKWVESINESNNK